MINLATRLSATLILIILVTSNSYSNVISKDPNNTQQNNIIHIEDKIKKKQAILLKTQKSDTTQYMSLYDDVVELTISKNKLLLALDRVDDMDTDRTYELAMNYAEVEFIKTQYYKTPFHDEVAKTLENIASLYELCHPPMAEKYLQSIVKIKEYIYLKESAEVAKANDALGDYYRIYMANFKKAIEYYEEAKRIREKIYGEGDPRSTENYGRLASSIFYHGDKNRKAEKILLQSIIIRKNSPINTEFPLYLAYMDAGMYYAMVGNYANSISTLIKAKDTFVGKQKSDYDSILRELAAARRNINPK